MYAEAEGTGADEAWWTRNLVPIVAGGGIVLVCRRFANAAKVVENVAERLAGGRYPVPYLAVGHPPAGSAHGHNPIDNIALLPHPMLQRGNTKSRIVREPSLLVGTHSEVGAPGNATTLLAYRYDIVAHIAVCNDASDRPAMAAPGEPIRRGWVNFGEDSTAEDRRLWMAGERRYISGQPPRIYQNIVVSPANVAPSGLPDAAVASVRQTWEGLFDTANRKLSLVSGYNPSCLIRASIVDDDKLPTEVRRDQQPRHRIEKVGKHRLPVARTDHYAYRR